MKKVDLPHYGLMGIFDFLKSDEAIKRAEERKTSRLDYKADAGQDRRDTRLETGEIRRDTRVIKQEIRQNNIVNGTGGSGLLSSIVGAIFTPAQTPAQTPNYSNVTPYEPKTNNAGGIMLGVLVVSGIAGAFYFGNKDKDPNSKTK